MIVHMPGMRALRTFDAAARHLNFTRAADELGLTPAAVSYQIKEIEDQLGLALFVRTSRAIRLTPAGLIVHEGAVEALEAMRRSVGRARKLARGERRLRVTADPVFAGKWLMPRIESFRKLHPTIELRFDISSGVRDFESDDVDVGIRFGAGRYPGVVSHRLFYNLIVPVCSPDLLRTGPPLQNPADLARHTLAHIDWARPGII
ncbi:LysR family transcriptional regulator, partial [Salmonella enterica subsp. enterica]|nr:LysR family transcriptional regulator [Salmonella enterica subsp. enterica serovar Enteritidis]